MIVDDAVAFAERLLARDLPRRWAHSLGALRAARHLAPVLGRHADLLATAAVLHDVGYAREAVDTGQHMIDGGRLLRRRGVDPVLCSLVAWHTSSPWEARELGLTEALAQFPQPERDLLDALVYADLTSAPDGTPVDPHARLEEILARYGAGHVVTRGIGAARPELLAKCARVEARLAALGVPRGGTALPPAPAQLVLWDVDDTLIASNGASGSTHAAAFEALTGTEATARVPIDGRTDRLIMRDLFTAHHIPLTADLEDLVEQALATSLVEMVPPFTQVRSVLPGVADTLAALAAEPALVQSVLTGNVTANARTKLAAFDLDRFLDLEVAATGSDAEIRAQLPDIARRRAAGKYGVWFAGHATVVIGDTVRDVQAASAAGARSIAVATGKDSAQDLAGAGASIVLPNLTDPRTLPVVLRHLRQQTDPATP